MRGDSNKVIYEPSIMPAVFGWAWRKTEPPILETNITVLHFL